MVFVRRARFGHIVAVLSLVLAMVVADSVVASADTGSSGGDHEFSMVGYGCEVDTLSETTSEGETTIELEERGTTVADIPLMTGALVMTGTVEVDSNGYGWTSGTWELDPDASTGTLTGHYWGSVGSDDSRVVVHGSGSGALDGVQVSFTVTPGTDGGDAPCGDASVFDATGSAAGPVDEAPAGMVIVDSTVSFDTTLTNLTDALEANPNIRIVKTVDHQAGAASRDLVLPPTTEVFFGNPALGTPLMQSAQTAGIDLPQKMLVWTDLFGDVKVGYNAPSYLVARHGIEGADGQLGKIAGALANFAAAATGTEPMVTSIAPTSGAPDVGDGLVVVPSALSVGSTVDALVAALDAAPPINVVFTLDHDVNAAKADLELDPTRLIVFGNPSLGTPLIQTNQTVALDLPQKMLVIEDDDENVSIVYNDPAYVADRHGIEGQDEVIAKITGALAKFSGDAGTS